MKKNGKHILILTPGFAKDETDGTCIPMLQQYILAYNAKYPDDTLTILAFQYPFVSKRYKWKGISVHSIGGRNFKLPFRILTWIKVVRRFQKINNYHKIDVIHSFWLTECTLVGQFLAKKNGIPQIATAMGQDCRKGNFYNRSINFIISILLLFQKILASI